MRACISFLMAMLVGIAVVFGQTIDNVRTEISPVDMYQSNVGITGYDIPRQRAGVIWPRGSNNQFVFAIGLWLGGHVLVGDNEFHKLVGITLNPNTGTGWCEAKSVVEADDDVTKHSTVYTSSFDDANLDKYDNPSKRAAEGYPLGLDIQQRLTVFSEGEFKDVAILQTTVRNNHPTRDIYNFIIGTLVDADVGMAQNPQHAAFNDRSEILSGSNQVGIVKFWDDSVSALWNPGVMGVAFVDSPAWVAMNSVKVERYTDFSYQGNVQRYDAMSTQTWDAWPAPDNLISLFGKEPLERLAIGESASSMMVLMFGSENSAENDQQMISMVERLRGTVSVNDDAHSDSQTSIFPNPAAASHVYLLSDRDVDRLEVYTAFGQLVKSIVSPTSTIDIDELVAGQYHLVLYSGRDVDRHRLVVLR